MRLNYDERTRQYYDANGRVISLAQIVKIVDRVESEARKAIRSLTRDYNAGRISLTAWEIGMREILKQFSSLSAAIAVGGKDSLKLNHWGKVGAALKKQYRYLSGFERKIKAGKLTSKQINYRSQLYAASIRILFFQLRQTEETKVETPKAVKREGRRLLNSGESCDGCIREASREWVAVETMSAFGSHECGQFCKCEFEFRTISA
jgi:hypothetical protein